MSEPITVRWCIYCDNDELEEWLTGQLVEVEGDNRGLYARVDTGDGVKVVELRRFDRGSYLKAQAAYPQFWERNY